MARDPFDGTGRALVVLELPRATVTLLGSPNPPDFDHAQICSLCREPVERVKAVLSSVLSPDARPAWAPDPKVEALR